MEAIALSKSVLTMSAAVLPAPVINAFEANAAVKSDIASSHLPTSTNLSIPPANPVEPSSKVIGSPNAKQMGRFCFSISS